MKKRNGLTLGLLVVIALLIVVAYYVMGIGTEKTIKHDLEVVNRSNGVVAKIIDYKRGFTTSQAQLDLRLHVPERIVAGTSGQPEMLPAQDYEMQVPMVIHHGPIIFADKTIKLGMGYANSDIPLPAKYVDAFNNLFTNESTRPHLQMSIFVNYLNNSQIEMALPAFKLIAKEGGQFEWMGMTSFAQVKDDAKKIKGNIQVDGFKMHKDDAQAALDKMTVAYQLRKELESLYVGTADFNLSSMAVTKKDTQVFQLGNLDILSSCDIKEGLFGSQLNIAVDKIFASGKTYGPGKLDMALTNLDAQSLARIHQQVQKAQGNGIENQQSMLAILPEVPKLLSRGTQFEISTLSFVMPQGTVEGNLKLNLPAGESSNPFELLQKIQGNGRLKVPAEVLHLLLDEANRQKLYAQTMVMGEANAAAQSNPLPVSTDATAAGTVANPSDATASTTTESNPSAVANTATESTVDSTVPSTATPAAEASTASTPAPAASDKEIDEQVKSMTKIQVDAMLQSGLIVKVGDAYQIEALLDKGQLTVNNKPFNAAMIKF